MEKIIELKRTLIDSLSKLNQLDIQFPNLGFKSMKLEISKMINAIDNFIDKKLV